MGSTISMSQLFSILIPFALAVGLYSYRPLRFFNRLSSIFLPLLMVAFTLGPIVLIGASLIHADRQQVADPFSIFMLACAGAVTLYNLFMKFASAYVYQRRHGSSKGYMPRPMEPVIVEIFLVLGVSFSFGNLPVAAMGLMIELMNPESLLWLALSLWRNRKKARAPARADADFGRRK